MGGEQFAAGLGAVEEPDDIEDVLQQGKRLSEGPDPPGTAAAVERPGGPVCGAGQGGHSRPPPRRARPWTAHTAAYHRWPLSGSPVRPEFPGQRAERN
ncbi:hypothetical protein GCM10023082_09630 [Streptomyces tremellae]|uniref:Uncharacterized protein n=1 Tax=Streptomyces tremellae TaxID=1124239 RepID=A0ABP7E3X6_9ACTN